VTGRLSLNARLMAGLLAVTTIGMVIMCVVSALVLYGYLMGRVDDQLRGARDLAVPRLAKPGLPQQGVAPARYIVLNLPPRGNRMLPVSGPDPDPSLAMQEVRRLGPVRLRGLAAGGQPFDLAGGLRAVARVGQRGNIVVVATPLTEIKQAVLRLVLAEVVTMGALLALLAGLGRWLTGRGLSPLSRMATTAHAIATGGDLRARMDGADTRTEVGRLAGSINVMLGRIEQAFAARADSEQRVREFAADASHELRTPLTTIQGYAELYRQGAVEPDRLPETMGRIEDEARRMSRLVGELLELARLDRGVPLDLAPADLAEIARDAAADAAAVNPGRPITLEVPQTFFAVVDEARVRQVLSNLLANVRAHTPEGTPVTVRLTGAVDRVVLEVRDGGPGMSPQDAARAFQRFHRARRTPGGGSGLGLAIVAAIAAAHGGQATLGSSPGAGTAVQVDLPRRT
jgi:signal transduction histidine kinase